LFLFVSRRPPASSTASAAAPVLAMAAITPAGLARSGLELSSKLLVVKHTFLEFISTGASRRRNRRCLSDTDLVAPGVPNGAGYDSSDQSEDEMPGGPAGRSPARRALPPPSAGSAGRRTPRVGWQSGREGAGVDAAASSEALASASREAAPRQLAAVTRALQPRRTARGRRQEPRTTVMLRNLPAHCTRASLLEMLDAEGFSGHYDFVYMPSDFRSRAGLGYAFVNVADPALVPRFWATFSGYSRWALPSTKVCQVSWSKPYQGLHANVQRYRNSSVMHPDVPEECKPCAFLDGLRAPFPSPTKALQPPCSRSPLA